MFRFLFLLGLFWGLDLTAQAVLIDLGPSNPSLRAWAVEQGPRLLRRGPVCPEQRLGLPFFDDFSHLDSFYPSCSRWQDNQVFINGTMAFRPPSIGVATFDGLNALGEPYNRNINTALSYSADTLTSQLFDFSAKNEANRLVLSYFLQAQGLGDRPEVVDSFVVEFRNRQGNWQIVKAYSGVQPTVSSLVIPPFFQDFVYIEDTAFFHADFQFRFRNRAAISGNNDHWHLDYVYLDENRDSIPPVRYPDVAYVDLPSQPLKPYTAVPWQHFSPQLWRDSLDFRLQNHSAISGTLDREALLFDEDGVLLRLNPLPALTYSPSPSLGDSLLGFGVAVPTALNLQGPMRLLSEYRILNPTDFQNNPFYFQNDTARRVTVLDDYFAFDDGTAERRIIAQGVGTSIAMEFRATVADTLWGIWFHMPHFTSRNAEQDFVNVKVWLDALTNEAFSKDIYRLRYEEGFNGWHFVPLTDFFDSLTPVLVEPNQRFYVGWEQASNTPVPIGFDRNTDASAYTWIAPSGGNWEASTLSGAVMMRPSFKRPLLPPVSVERLAEQEQGDWLIFPNPCRDWLELRHRQEEGLLPQHLAVYDALGRLVLRENQQARINLLNLPSGIYFLEIQPNLTQPVVWQRFQKL